MSAKKIKIGQKTVDNFEILLKKMGGDKRGYSFTRKKFNKI